MDSLDDRVAGHNPHLPLDLFERHADGTYRRVGSMSNPSGPTQALVTPPSHRMGWRTWLQIFGVSAACTTLSIAVYNLYDRTHGHP